MMADQDYRIGNIKLSFSKAEKIRELYESGYNQRELAELFAVSRRTINDIVMNRSWKPQASGD